MHEGYLDILPRPAATRRGRPPALWGNAKACVIILLCRNFTLYQRHVTSYTESGQTETPSSDGTLSLVVVLVVISHLDKFGQPRRPRN